MEHPKLVIVDDDHVILQAAKNVLNDICDVFTVTTAEGMFDVLAQNSPMLILLDINMPGMNGFEILQRLKADPATRAIPVVFLTGVQAPESEYEGLSLGAIDYILKPFSPQLLFRRVELHILIWKQRRLIKEQARMIEHLTKKQQDKPKVDEAE